AAQHDVDLAEARAHVESTHRQRGWRPTGSGNASVAGTGGAVVAGRRDDESVEPRCTCGGGCQWAVGERRERLGDADQCHARRIVLVAVPIRIDCALEPGETLIGPSVDRPARGRVALPTGDPDREDRAPG